VGGSFVVYKHLHLPKDVVNIYVMKCTIPNALKEWQYKKLLEHIAVNQYYLGERLGHFVDWNEAEHDFFECHVINVAHDLRLEFCNTICDIQDCRIRTLFNNKG
jgi:hypothetical protein